MATTEQFSLRWNNFHSNLTSGFHDLLEAHDMVDVTLAVEGQFLQAHKIVLSICSPFFKQLFKMNPCKHPVVILKDVTYGNLKDILEFMYLGEVNVLRDNLSAFLRTAELLQVKGLTGDDSSETSSKKDEKTDSVCDNELEQDIQQFTQLIESSDPSVASQYSSAQLPSSPPIIAPVTHTKRPSKNATANTGIKRIKSENSISQSNKSSIKLSQSPEVGGNLIMQSTEDESDYLDPSTLKIEPLSYSSENEDGTPSKDALRHLMEASGGGLTSSQDLNAQDHGYFVEKLNKHPYKCEKCAKRFSRRDHLRTHEKNIHGEDAGPFACVICTQMYKNSESLRKHIAKFHYQKLNDLHNKIQADA